MKAAGGLIKKFPFVSAMKAAGGLIVCRPSVKLVIF